MIVTILAAVFGFSMGIASRHVSRLDKKLTLLKNEVDELKRKLILEADKQMILERHIDINLKLEKNEKDLNYLYNQWIHQLHQNERRVVKLEKDVVDFLNSDVVGK